MHAEGHRVHTYLNDPGVSLALTNWSVPSLDFPVFSCVEHVDPHPVIGRLANRIDPPHGPVNRRH